VEKNILGIGVQSIVLIIVLLLGIKKFNYFIKILKMNASKLLKKYLAGEKMTKKEIDYLWKRCRDKADQVFSQWIRNRDKQNGCITKEVSACQHRIDHNAHRIER